MRASARTGRLRYALLGLFLVIAAGCATPKNRHLPGQSIANDFPLLRRDAIRAVAIFEAALVPGTRSLTVKDTRVIQPPVRENPMRLDLAHAQWTERWIIERSASNVSYTLRFTSKGRKGTEILVSQDKAGLTNGTETINVK